VHLPEEWGYLGILVNNSRSSRFFLFGHVVDPTAPRGLSVRLLAHFRGFFRRCRDGAPTGITAEVADLGLQNARPAWAASATPGSTAMFFR